MKMLFRVLAMAAWIAFLAGLTGCADTDRYSLGTCPEGEDCSLPGTALVFEVREDQPGFFDTPWPCDTRLDAEGGPDLAEFPNPGNSSMLASYIETVQAETRGFGTNAAVYFAFDGPLDPESLPAFPADTLDRSSSAFLVDVSDGPGRGERIPLAVRFFPEERQFTPANTLVLRPVLGFPLRQNTRYAVVVTRKVKSDGRSLGAWADFERTKYDDPPESEPVRSWWEVLHPVYEDLQELSGADRGNVAALAVFTTQDVLSEMDAVAAFVASEPAPQASGWNRLSDKAQVYRLEAWFEMPEFQAGQPPDFEDGGGFAFDQDGRPVVQRRLSIPFTLALPKGRMTAAGWPIVIYSHGTGGSRNGFTEGIGSVADKLGQRGIASIGIDQPLHGDRNPWGREESIVTFNPYNILAMRDNFRQGAADMLVLRRLLSELTVPADASPTGAAVLFDDERVGYMGHSQGSLNGPLFLSVASGTRGAVFSGSGGGLGPAILGKTEPVDIPALIILAMGLVPEEFDLDHPLISAFQIFAERADPLNYARRLLVQPTSGVRPRHLYFSQGLLDEYALPEQAAAMAAASGCSPMEPLREPIEAFRLRGRDPLGPPISGNAEGPDGNAYTAVMVQYPDDGHFAVFDNPDAQRHYLGFLQSLLLDDLPSVGP